VVLIHGLPADGWSMRLEASVAADKLRDSYSNNNAVLFSPMIGDTTSGGGDGGGGGAFDLIGLLLLLAAAGWRRASPAFESE